jgi:hypothetical protein
MTNRPAVPSGKQAFPQPRLNRELSRIIDQAVALAVRHPRQASTMLHSAGVDAITVARLLSSWGRRRPIVRSPGTAAVVVAAK